jgi:Flp pilus assembly protein TadD
MLKIAASLVVVTALLSGCAAPREIALEVATLANQPVYPVADPDILALTPAMLEFLEKAVGADVPRSQRPVRLARATLGAGELGFSYEPLLTLTAADAFEKRSGNCLAFSNLFIAMARHLGLDAWYQEVPLPPQWSDVDGVWLVNLHVNAVVAARNGFWIVDVSGEQVFDNKESRRLTDAEAHGLYLNNLGAEALLAHDLPRAYAYLRKALGVAPKLPHAWSNLGVAYDRNGQVADAIRAYQLALRYDPVESRAADNLFRVYEREGNLQASAKLRRRVESRRRRNPYYQHQLARQALTEQRYEEASRFLRRAIALNDEDYRFHYDLARSLALQGDTDAARKSLERARDLAGGSELSVEASLADLLPVTD